MLDAQQAVVLRDAIGSAQRAGLDLGGRRRYGEIGNRCILANSALDRLANGAHQLVIEGPSYRAKLAPKPPPEPPMT